MLRQVRRLRQRRRNRRELRNNRLSNHPKIKIPKVVSIAMASNHPRRHPCKKAEDGGAKRPRELQDKRVEDGGAKHQRGHQYRRVEDGEVLKHLISNQARKSNGAVSIKTRRKSSHSSKGCRRRRSSL